MTRSAWRSLVFAAVVCGGAAALAACGRDDDPDSAHAADATRDDAAAARGRTERAFWASYDAARAALARGDETAARTAFEQALVQKPDHAASIYALAGIEHRAGRFDAALALCERLLAVDRPRTRAFLLRAAIHSDVEAALAAGREWASAASQPAWIDLAKAEADAAAGEAENPEETGPHIARAKVALLRGDVATAEAGLERALTIHPGHAEAMILRSVAARRRGAPADAEASIRRALAATTPKTNPFPPGEGDTQATLNAVMSLDTARLRALAAALRWGIEPWPADAPPRPAVRTASAGGGDVLAAGATTPDPLRVTADFDGDGSLDELVARRAPERDALLSLFGIHDAARGSITLRLGGDTSAGSAPGATANTRDATASSGLLGVAACAARVVVLDADRDGRPDVLVLPGDGDPSRQEPKLLLRNLGAGRFDVAVVAEAGDR